MRLKDKWNLPEWLTAGLVFVYYWIMALFRLMDAPIWQDETMEFYCSIPVKGAIQGITQYETMYERMANIQQQPPLYNWVMCLWLQISEDGWWYRFSSVVMVFVAVVGLYLVMKKLCDRFTATLSVFVFSSIYILMYYVKEASEYSMLIMLLIWTVYLYLHILEKVTIKRVLGFAVMCVVNIYTHYGAAFVMVPMAVQLLFYYMRQKDWKAFKTSLVSYVVAAVGAGVPLILFFLIPQSKNPVSTMGIEKPLEITGNNIILDFFDSMMWVLRWCMLDYDRDWDKLTWAIWILLFVLIIIGIIVYRCTKRKELKMFINCNIGTYLIYYVLTTLNFYAYGWFGNRYNLFILPMWFILIVVILHEFLRILAESGKEWIRKIVPVMQVGVVLAALLFSCYGVKRINDHWMKMDLRTVASTWYEREGYQIPTYVNFHQRYPFVYYFTHDDAYTEDKWEHVYCSQNLESLSYTAEEWIEFLQTEVYPNGLPEKLYVVSGQVDTIARALENYGYTIEELVDTTAELLLLTAPEEGIRTAE